MVDSALRPFARSWYSFQVMDTNDQFTALIEQVSGDEKAMALFERVLETTLAQRQAMTAFRAYMVPHHGSEPAPAAASISKRAHKGGARIRANSLTQRALQTVVGFGGKAVSTTILAAQLETTEAQVRGALKRFVREGTISKPRRGLWLAVDRKGRMNVNGANAAR